MLNPLVGRWKADSRDKKTTKYLGNVTLDFSYDGQLIYTIHGEDKDQKVFLTYRIQGKTLITNQPSKPKEEKTKFKLTSDVELSLFFEGYESRYVKVVD